MPGNNIQIEDFRSRLLEWSSGIDRPMPWKGEKDPYLIWLSEIILQQTRVEQGMDYFLRFKAAFPTVSDLAQAEEDQVLALWQGLGYYSRARNLLKAARIVHSKYKDVFPESYEEILKLPGIGPYTAAAIASFAFDLPEAVVDGNVYRVFARLLNINTPIDTTSGKKEFKEVAYRFLDEEAPGSYNQALMDFGALCCTPKKPACRKCPFSENCKAKKEETHLSRPVKSRKLAKKDRYFHYLRINTADKTLIQKRSEKDIWAKLYEFPMIESQSLEEPLEKVLQQTAFSADLLDKSLIIRKYNPQAQVLSHQRIFANCFEITINETFETNSMNQIWVSRENLENYAFPKIIHCFLSDNSLSLFD